MERRALSPGLAIVLLAALVIALWLWATRSEIAPPTAVQPSGSPAVVSASPGSETTRESLDTPTPSTRTPAGTGAAPPLSATGQLIVRASWPDGLPAEGLVVQVEPAGTDPGDLQDRHARTAHDGVASFDDLPPGKGQLRVEFRQGAAFSITAGATAEVEVRLAPGIEVRGIVVDGGGAPVPTARVWLSRPFTGDEGLDVGPVAADGTFVLRAVPPRQMFVAARAPDLRASSLAPIDGTPGSAIDVRLVLSGPGVGLTVQVLLPDGKPAAAARVLIGNRGPGQRWHLDSVRQMYRPPVEGICDGRGEFTAHGLEPGATTAVWARHRDSAPATSLHPLPSAGHIKTMVQLARGATVQGTITVPPGMPLDKIGVVAWAAPLVDLTAPLRRFAGPTWAVPYDTADTDGRYEVRGIPGGHVRLIANDNRATTTATIDVDVLDGERRVWDPVLAGGNTVRGRVVDEQGHGLPDWRVSSTAADEQLRIAVTDAEGNFLLTNCGTGPLRVTVDVVNAAGWESAITQLGVLPDGTPRTFVVPASHLPSVYFIGRVHKIPALAGNNVQLNAWRTDRREPVLIAPNLGDDGAFRIGPLTAGTWRLCARIDGTTTPWTPSVTVPAGRTHDFGELHWQPAGSLRATVATADGRPLEAVECELVDPAGGVPLLRGASRNGVLVLPVISEGTWVLRTMRDPVFAATTVTIQGGIQATAELIVDDGLPCTLRCTPPSAGTPQLTWWQWFHQGKPLRSHVLWILPSGPKGAPRRLAAGDYEVVVTAEDGTRATTTFTVRVEDGERTFTITMP